MEKKIVKIKNDMIIKSIFFDIDNEDLLHDFISSILNIPYNLIKSIVIQNPEILSESLDGKLNGLKLRMKIDDTPTNVELQIKNKFYSKEEALNQWASLYADELEVGDEYNKLKKSILLNIVGSDIFDCDEYQSIFKIVENSSGELLTDKCEIIFIELKKLPKKPNINNRIELWLKVVGAETEEELEILYQTEIPEIMKMITIIREMREDERFQ